MAFENRSQRPILFVSCSGSGPLHPLLDPAGADLRFTTAEFEVRGHGDLRLGPAARART